MYHHKKKIAAFVCLASMSGFASIASGQDADQTEYLAEEVSEDFLQLTDPMLSIWPEINQETLDIFDSIVDDLVTTYERDRRTADGHKDDLEDLIRDARDDEDIVKDRINEAKKAEDEVEKSRLEALKDSHEARRKYLERIKNIREQERKVNDARVDYYKAWKEMTRKASQLINAREGGKSSRQLLAIEEEVINQAKRVSNLNDKVAGLAKKLNDQRADAFREREKIMKSRAGAG